jgi:putative transposase
LRDLFRDRAHHRFEIEEMKVVPYHVHLFFVFPLRCSIAHVVGILKSISASEIFDELSEVKREFWEKNFGRMDILRGRVKTW